jgi:hypothetical protein
MGEIMSYKLNGKSLSVGRLMVRGKDPKKAPPRMKCMIVGPKGSMVVTPSSIVRVSLPDDSCKFDDQGKPLGSLVYAQDELDAVQRPAPESATLVQMPEGQPAVDGPMFMVPKTDDVFFKQTADMPVFVFNADKLRTLLTIASEVCEDSDKVTRMIVDLKNNQIRLDTYRQPGDQEFCAVMKGVKYSGDYIPNEKEEKAALEVKPEQQNLLLPVVAGRKFRGEGE